ncbi:16S rRNA (cytosine(1402)-N(4))-methyltransferase [Candidatus Nomurabacteria bacterium RIFOXYB1_FULL_39_16]|uniref:Ribosomal RNA small subunit methyltransferase H n=2 Tax=Candidatus Nomuraibacteriota TaxID=1752729 RepID=A0A0G0TA35_9BACT|nr:MAG: Ribosomal RNA small subunit methyltransferase H [Candidatus Nomurabacteria bacterium GW2011_GWF2_40_12]OGJ08863.1 MAG: 16S rRNA (cytosine(1402)-N(4))-methyltransferase [Candidatus Nomurabacteria bacterium RIFOXYB1_FULL_39_16]OGJ14920.1 MAG: 16S rRNA (cytosine(1402)-N(4))-methyltransferase [Candidatus Nomurabacteria bacterium RIFOXYD1_FULL_39_12]
MYSVHKTVLLNETIDGLLAPSVVEGNENLVVLDATFGGGGHSKEILKRFPKAKVVALDQDKSVWQGNDLPAQTSERISFYNENFRDLDKVLGGEKVDGIIFDLGLSSDQLENSGRGFSFQKDEPLLMTMKKSPNEEDLTAEEIVNTWEEKNLADIIYGYGEERFSRRIAKGIVEARAKAKIETTADLVKVISDSVPAVYRRGRIHFATRTFQALRIAVNDELRSLQTGLEKGFSALKEGGRMSVITFHSLEDRIVKKYFKALEKEGKVILINKKPILESEKELKNNPRARSAKLRILSRL